MSDKGRATAQWVAVLLAALGLAAGLAMFAARAAAAGEVRMVESRVSRLEAQREEDSKNIDEMKRDIKELLRRVR